MPVIRIGGKKPASSSSKKSSTTSKTRSTSSKRTSSKRVGRATPAKKQTSAKKTGAKRGAPRGPRTPKIAPTVLAKHEKALKAAGKDRRDAESAHDKAVENVHRVVKAAIKAEVPMSIISERVGVSRQWLYKMGTHRDRQNGSGPASGGRATTASRSTKRSSSKRVRPRVRSK